MSSKPSIGKHKIGVADQNNLEEKQDSSDLKLQLEVNEQVREDKKSLAHLKCKHADSQLKLGYYDVHKGM